MKLHSAAPLLALALTIGFGTVALTGCGGSSGDSTPVVTSSTYGSRGIDLGSGKTADLALTTKSDGTATGTLSITDPSRAKTRAVFVATLAGTSGGGSFDVSGSYPDGQASVPVRVAGTLPSAPGAAGGSLTATVSGVAHTGAFTTTATPTPAPTPTPVATPTPAPTPTPTPGSGNLLRFFPSYASTDRLTYRETTTTTQTINGQTTTRTNTSTFDDTSGLFGDAGSRGARTTVVLDGVTVTKEQQLNSTGQVDGYTYYTQDATGYTLYGTDEVNVTSQQTTSTSRYSPAIRFRFDISVGQSYSVSTTLTHVDLTDNNKTTATQYTYTFSYLANESVAVTAGTFANSAKIRLQFQYTTTEEGETLSFSSDATSWYAEGIGEVKSISRFTNSGTLFSSQIDSTQELISGKVGTRTLP
jgi:hypothetical protein